MYTEFISLTIAEKSITFTRSRMFIKIVFIILKSIIIFKKENAPGILSTIKSISNNEKIHAWTHNWKKKVTVGQLP